MTEDDRSPKFPRLSLLPAIPEEAAHEAPRGRPVLPPEAPEAETLLLIHGDAANADVLRLILEDARYRVTVVPSVKDALKALAWSPTAFSLVLADPEVPMVVDLGDHLDRAGPPTLRYVSDAKEGELRSRGAQFPSRHLLHEPFTASDLVSRVRSWIEEGGFLH